MKPLPLYRIRMPNEKYPLLPLRLAVEFERHLQKVAQNVSTISPGCFVRFK